MGLADGLTMEVAEEAQDAMSIAERKKHYANGLLLATGRGN